MSSGRWRKHTQAGVITSVLMSSSSDAGSTSRMRSVTSPASWRRRSSRSFVRYSTRRAGSRRTTRVPSARVWIKVLTAAPGWVGSGLRVLDQERDPLAAADAGRGDAEALPRAAELVGERQDEPRARRAQRVAERDRAAV